MDEQKLRMKISFRECYFSDQLFNLSSNGYADEEEAMRGAFAALKPLDAVFW